ncbi:hypothetical protein [Bacillus toyonensis]|uniref:hypothetical protein n=1 Tax=Bacillus toyonensis TaxID=155322 RepID=UPI000BF50FEC|nr:hypothetical protein [Bacillus toyonensis]PGE66901.1 hypothetical protein COM69_18225 [Bacillus toyonensis]PHD40118.1 hypothetical protein COF65_19715 [Bacillus toyonensis]
MSNKIIIEETEFYSSGKLKSKTKLKQANIKEEAAEVLEHIGFEFVDNSYIKKDDNEDMTIAQIFDLLELQSL